MPTAASWRPFQLAFILLNLPALTDPAHPDRVLPAGGGSGSGPLVDLLFFPTGGGKTEAYLGLAAITFAIRRLQGTVGTGAQARSGDAGVAVLMRYTLRLLTAQQFQRAAALVCAAEMIRRDAGAAGDGRWGAEPFRIGLWVGGAVSPNWFDNAAEEVSDVRESAAPSGPGCCRHLSARGAGPSWPRTGICAPTTSGGGSCCTARPGRGRMRARSRRPARRARACRS